MSKIINITTGETIHNEPEQTTQGVIDSSDLLTYTEYNDLTEYLTHYIESGFTLDELLKINPSLLHVENALSIIEIENTMKIYVTDDIEQDAETWTKILQENGYPDYKAVEDYTELTDEQNTAILQAKQEHKARLQAIYNA